MSITTKIEDTKGWVKDKVKDVKWKVKNKVCDDLNWIYNNKETVMVATPFIVAGIKAAGKVATGAVRYHTENKAVHNRDMRCYDPSQGHYWELKRKLSSNEWMRVNDRRKRGESLGDILSSMNVLK